MLKAIFISVRTGSTRLPNKSILKIENKHTKECILDRPHIRVLADSNVSIKKQYLDLIANKK